MYREYRYHFYKIALATLLIPTGSHIKPLSAEDEETQRELGPQEESKTLKLAAVSHQVNKEKIVSWRGQAKVSDEEGLTEEGSKGKIKRVMTGSVYFVYDQKTNTVRWNWTNESVQIHRANGDVINELNGPIKSGMMKNEILYALRIDPSRNTKSNVLRILSPSSKKVFTASSQTFHPMFYFNKHGRDLPNRLRFICEHSNEKRLRYWSSSRKGELIQIVYNRTATYNKPKLNIQYIVNMAKSGCLESWKSVEDSKYGGTESWTATYMPIKGIWIPENVTYENYRTTGTYFKRNIEFTESILNEPTSPNDFLFSTLGARVGDRVQDTRAKVQYTINSLE